MENESEEEKIKREAEEAAAKKKSEDSGNNSNNGNEEISPLDEAREINLKKEELLKRDEELQTRKEKLEAQRMVGGRSGSGQTLETKEETPKEYNDRVEKEISEGKHDE